MLAIRGRPSSNVDPQPVKTAAVGPRNQLNRHEKVGRRSDVLRPEIRRFSVWLSEPIERREIRQLGGRCCLKYTVVHCGQQTNFRQQTCG